MGSSRMDKVQAAARLKAFQQAVLEHDGPTLARALGDGFALTGTPRLGVLGKAAWIEAALEFEWRSFDVEITDVVERGDVAVVVGRVTQSATWKGADASGRFLTVDVWHRSGEQWTLEGRYASRIER